MWVYDEKGALLCNDLPEDLQGKEELDKLCREVQQLYESQFIDNETTFEYVGFPTQTQQDAFWEQLSRLTQCLAEANKSGGRAQ